MSPNRDTPPFTLPTVVAALAVAGCVSQAQVRDSLQGMAMAPFMAACATDYKKAEENLNQPPIT